MRDKLQEYVQDHLAAFDRHEAPDVWAQVSAGIKAPKPISKQISKITMIKFGIGLTVITTGTLLVLNNAQVEKTVQVSPTPSEEPARTAVISESSDSALVLPEKGRTIFFTRSVKDSTPPSTKIDSLTSALVSFLEPAALPAMACRDSVSSTGMLDTDTLFTGITVLNVDVQDCNLMLKGTPNSSLHLKAHIAPGGGYSLQLGKHMISRRQDYLRYSKSGNQLKVWISCEKTGKNVHRTNETSEILIEIPAGVKVQADNGMGNIHADSLLSNDISLGNDYGNIMADHIKGAVKAKTSSGKMRLSHVTGNVNAHGDFGSMSFEDIRGNLTANCSSGQVQVNGLQGDADVKSSFGSQRFTRVTGNIKTTASSGSLLFDECTGDVVASSDFGSQTFRKLTGAVHAEASSGTIKLSETSGMLDVETNFGSIKGENVRLAGSAKLKASSGTIQIDFVNPISDLRFDLNCDSGTATVVDGDKVRKAEHHLSAGEGNILVTGTTTFGSQSYR